VSVDPFADREARVRQITEGNFGRVVGRTGNIMTVEIPADVSIGLYPIWGEAGLTPIFIGQETRLAVRRVPGVGGVVVVCDDMVTTAFYRFEINLDATARPYEPPTPETITRQRPPR
jgi:hypothetical protein